MSRHVIHPGRLKHSLYLLEATKVHGNPGPWDNVAENPLIRCDIKTLASSETSGASGERGQRKLELTMRYRSDVTYDKRFGDGGERVFDIESIDNVNELNHKLIVIVVERTNG